MNYTYEKEKENSSNLAFLDISFSKNETHLNTSVCQKKIQVTTNTSFATHLQL